MAYRLFGAKPSPEPMTYCQLDHLDKELEQNTKKNRKNAFDNVA